MIEKPYVRTPVPPAVALMTATGTVVDEHGDELDLDDWPTGTRCWASYDAVRQLVREGRGEATCWNLEEVHWRHERFEDEWRPRASDVHVLRIPEPASAEGALEALSKWRDWLASYGASPTGTTGSAAWSLLKATLTGPLATGEPWNQCPPLRWTIGGRQELGPAGKGSFVGDLEQWDLPQAYAVELGNLAYGGWWLKGSDHGDVSPERWDAHGRAVFVAATVRVPDDLGYGPLPRRPRKRPTGMLAMLGCEYPVGRTLAGVWTWEELQAAEAAGCRILRVRETWFHVSSRQPFLRWLEAVQAGRAMGGLAGQLAKMTGNALWGRFCMDSRGGSRAIRSLDGRRMTLRPLAFRGGLRPAHDLAETVSGRVRARLYRAMIAAGDRLVSAHTDGVWLEGRVDGEGWRRKQVADALDLLSPQTLRYRVDGAWRTVFAGVPPMDAVEAFGEAWDRFTSEGIMAA